MKNRKMVWIILLAFVLLLAGAGVLYNRLAPQVESNQLSQRETTQPPAAETQTPTGQETSSSATEEAPPLAPDFTVYNLEGDPVQLSDYFGKPIVLNFWASWCGPCKMEMPDFQKKYEAMGEKISFLMVNMTDGGRETVESASDFIAEQGYTFPVFYDKDSDAANAYSVYSLPTTYFIDAQGCAVAQATGSIDADTLQQGIDMITE